MVFDAQVLIQATSFDAEAFDTQSEELTQPVLPSNATDLVNTDKLQVLTSAETRRDVLSSLEIAPRVLTPNGDAINDAAGIDFQILQVLEEVPIRIEVFRPFGAAGPDPGGHPVRARCVRRDLGRHRLQRRGRTRRTLHHPGRPSRA